MTASSGRNGRVPALRTLTTWVDAVSPLPSSAAASWTAASE